MERSAHRPEQTAHTMFSSVLFFFFWLFSLFAAAASATVTDGIMFLYLSVSLWVVSIQQYRNEILNIKKHTTYINEQRLFAMMFCSFSCVHRWFRWMYVCEWKEKKKTEEKKIVFHSFILNVCSTMMCGNSMKKDGIRELNTNEYCCLWWEREKERVRNQ